MKVRLTRAAEDDLDAIGDRIANDNPERAVSFIDEMVDRCRSLSSHSDRFPIARCLGSRVIRKMTHGRYLIFYYQWNGAVEISRIVHGSRDWTMIDL